MKTDPTLDTEAALFEAELARVREKNVAGRAVEETLARPELKKQLDELTADAPPGATGPFLRKAGALATRDEALPSERAEEAVTDGRNTNPVPKEPGPKASVLVGARKPGDSAAITAPSIARMAQVAAEPLVFVGRAPANTLKIKRTDESPSSEPAAPALQPESKPWMRALPWIAVLGGVAVILIFLAIHAATARTSESAAASPSSTPASGSTTSNATGPRTVTLPASTTATATATAMTVSVPAARTEAPATSTTTPREGSRPRKSAMPEAPETATAHTAPEPATQTPATTPEPRPTAATAAAPAGIPTW